MDLEFKDNEAQLQTYLENLLTNWQEENIPSILEKRFPDYRGQKFDIPRACLLVKESLNLHKVEMSMISKIFVSTYYAPLFILKYQDGDTDKQQFDQLEVELVIEVERHEQRKVSFKLHLLIEQEVPEDLEANNEQNVGAIL